MAIEFRDLQKLQKRGAQKFPEHEGGQFFVISLATFGDAFTPWGFNPVQRDRELRDFLSKENWTSSTISSLSARNAGFSWTLEGPPRTCNRIQEILHHSQYGKGWEQFIQLISADMYSQDNGAFVEVIRAGNSPTAPLLGLAHLDSGKVRRTGDLKHPYIYTDIDGVEHKLQWFQCFDLTDFPSGIETMYGMQICAISRSLKAAQLIRDVMLRRSEKAAGRYAGEINLVSGMRTELIEDAHKKSQEESNSRERYRYQPPLIIGTPDPNAKLSKEVIKLADVPEGFEIEKEMQWFIALMARAYNVEYQDLAPLPAGGLGTSQQSQVLHLKARGMGPEHFQKIVEHRLNFYVLPNNVNFKFTEQDFQAQKIEAEVRKLRWAGLKDLVESGTLTTEVAQQLLEDWGDISHEYLEMLQLEDITPEVTITDEEQTSKEPGDVLLQDEEKPVDEQRIITEAYEKALQDAGYWSKRRKQLEGRYEREMAAVLSDIRSDVIKMLKREMRTYV